jgi:aspartate carbamoyltransferase catalytic subunit
MKFKWNHKDLIDVDILTIQECDLIFKLAKQMEIKLKNKKVIKETLKKSNVFNLFYEPSTRTRASFELAAKQLGANVINIDANFSSVKKGETLSDTIKTISAMYADIIILRHMDSGAANHASENTNKVIINAGDGSHAHPTQALTDGYTMLKKFRSLKNKKIVMVGDIKHSRVARSNIWLLSKLGAIITLCGPSNLLPKNSTSSRFPKYFIERNINVALKNADVIMALRMQTERQSKNLASSLKNYSNKYQITSNRLLLANKNCLLMHPGPINEGIEISREVANSEFSKIEEQVANGVVVRMAILQLMFNSNFKKQ